MICGHAYAEPFITTGDLWLRSDLQRLSDAGVITSPVTTWPLSWGDIAEDVSAFTKYAALNESELAALTRIKGKMQSHLRVDSIVADAGFTIAGRPNRIRNFQSTPRGRGEVWLNTSYTGTRFAGKIQANYVASDSADGDEFRLDGSYGVVALGNWLLAASVQDRWWGPSWNGSLLLSNNARPIPAITLQRNFSHRPNHPWLRWIGPWSTSIIWGQLEGGRAVSNARLFGWRVNARPRPGLEIGFLRAAQWCGSGRNCSFDAFNDVLLGNTNLDEGVQEDVANQLAGFDVRWSLSGLGYPMAVYGQLIGEDEAQGFPSKYFGQAGLEVWGSSKRFGFDWRAYAEVADTTCQFHENSKIFNCTYNNSSYPEGYRYRNYAIGHSTDNDSRSAAVGVVLRRGESEWFSHLRHMQLNRGGAEDFANSLTSTPQDQSDFDIGYRRHLNEAITIKLQVGIVRQEGSQSDSKNNIRAFMGATINLRD